MTKSIVGLNVVAVALCVTQGALAEPFASHGTFAVGAERMFGIEHTKLTEETPGTGVNNPGSKTTTSNTSISLLGHASSNSLATLLSTPLAMPRLSLDVFLGPGISLGGALMYQHVGGSREQEPVGGASTKRDNGASIYLFAPRVGFGYAINEHFAIWPRLGISYLYVTGSEERPNTAAGGVTKNDNTLGYWFGTLDCMLMISPIEHVAFSVGPAFDLLIGGPTATEDGEGVATRDTSLWSLGLHSGLTVWF